MVRRLPILLAAFALLLTFTFPVGAQELPPAELLRSLIHPAEEGIEAAEQNNPQAMRAEYNELHDLWESFESKVRQADATGYVELESALDGIKDAVNAQPPDPAAVKRAYTQLIHEANEVADRLAGATGVGAQVRELATLAEGGVGAAKQNNPEVMRAKYGEIHEFWESFEDKVRQADATGYVELESALDAVKDAVNAQPVNSAAVEAAYEQLEHEADEIAGRLGAGATVTTPSEMSLPDALNVLDAASAALAQGDTSTAATQIDTFIRAWPGIEGAVATQSHDAYQAVEGEMGRARTALQARPADVATAKIAIERMQESLAPFKEGPTYTVFDAFIIILREGLEALLVIVALLAFLRKSGNTGKRGWIWAGGAFGILVSIATAFALQAIFSRVSAGTNRELIEGITGLTAAGLLFYVSYWLHSKASLNVWKTYIDQRTTQALARGNVIGLALLAFLAVFREGAETAVFYLGMAPVIPARDLFLGIALGVVTLVIAAVLMLMVGVRLPLRLFFRVAGLLVYYLGFKFVGTALHALQVGGAVPTTPILGLEPSPILEFFGIYLTWQTLLPQLVLLLGAIAVWLYLRAKDSKIAEREVVATT
jgi:high-affinity iron transporter